MRPDARMGLWVGRISPMGVCGRTWHQFGNVSRKESF